MGKNSDAMGNEMAVSPGLGLTRQYSQLGAFGVVREALKLCYRSPLQSIQFAVVLPYVTLTLFLQYFLQQTIRSNILFFLSLYQPQINTTSLAGYDGPHMTWRLGLLWVALIIFILSISLSVQGVLYSAVGSIYSGNNITLAQAFKAVPRLWKRLLVLSVYCTVVSWAVVLVLITMILLVVKFSAPGLALFVLLLTGVAVIALWIFTIVFCVAVPVTCYEESYGWAAFNRATKLLKENWISGVLLLVLCDIIAIIVSSWIGTRLLNVHSFRWTYVVLGVVYILLASWMHQFTRVLWAVFYFSCLEKHREQHTTHDTDAGYRTISTHQSAL